MAELTIQETAARINKHYITTLKLVHRGQLRGIRRGGQWYVTEAEVDRFLREGNYQEEEAK